MQISLRGLPTKQAARGVRGRGLRAEERSQRVDLAAQKQTDDAWKPGESTQPLNAEHQGTRIDAAALRHDPAQRARMTRPLRQQHRHFCLQWLDDAADDRNCSRANFLAFVTGDAVEYARESQ